MNKVYILFVVFVFNIFLFSCSNNESVKKTYYDSGIIHEEYIYLEDTIIYNKYNRKGILQTKGHIVNNLANGLNIKYYEDGSIDQIKYYKNSKIEGWVRNYDIHKKLINLNYYINSQKMIQVNYSYQKDNHINISYYNTYNEKNNFIGELVFINDKIIQDKSSFYSVNLISDTVYSNS